LLGMPVAGTGAAGWPGGRISVPEAVNV